MRASILAALAFAGTALLLTRNAPAADAERGRQLYEQRCTACHTQSVHRREGRKARDYNEVRQWVVRWNEVFNFRWDDEAVEDVTFYLNSAVYHYAVPASTPARGGAPETRSAQAALRRR